MSDTLSRRTLLALAGAAAATAAAARAEAPAILGRAPATRTLGGPAFGTRWQVTLPAGPVAPALRARIVALLRGIDAEMSPWRDDSELSALNRGGAGAHAVSPATARVARAALDMAAASGGAFDPTVGPLVARWGFGPISGAPGDWRGFSTTEGSVLKAEPGLTLDLCGIAKGHALDRIAATLAEHGHEDFLADLGGELLARGRHPSGRRWRVGVEDPRPGAAGLSGAIALDGQAVATSGDRAQGFDFAGRRYGHVIDPASGAPAAGRLAAVSVVAESAMAADAWATACMAAGARGPRLAADRGLAALFLFRDGAGLRPVATGGFDALGI